LLDVPAYELLRELQLALLWHPVSHTYVHKMGRAMVKDISRHSLAVVLWNNSMRGRCVEYFLFAVH
jgi:hypothetical protein